MDLLWPGFLVLLGLIPLLIADLYLDAAPAAAFCGALFQPVAGARGAARASRACGGISPLPCSCWRWPAWSWRWRARWRSSPCPPTRPPSSSPSMSRGACARRIFSPAALAAAEAAALSFIQRQKSTTQIGLVAFSGFAEIIQPPTTDQEALQAAVESLTAGRRTAIGSGILKVDGRDCRNRPERRRRASPTQPHPIEPAPVPQGAYAPDIIVLLTDGVSNAGILPLDAAQQAADRGVRVYTIGYGTDNGFIPFGRGGGFQGDPFGGGGGFGGGGFGGGRGRRRRFPHRDR